MRRFFLAATLSCGLMFNAHNANAQFATIDFSNLTQAILSFLQDGDNMALNTSQFLQNLGVAKEQLEFLREMNRRYKEVRQDIYKAQEVIRIANSYEMTLRMFSYYIERLKGLDGQKVQYYQVSSLMNQGFQYLLIASREVKRAREYLSSKSELSEDQRRHGLEDCDRQVSKANVAMYNHIVGSYSTIDRGEMIADTIKSMNEAFTIDWQRI